MPEGASAFDPAAYILPLASDTAAGRQAQAEAKRYFDERGITHLEVTGNDSGHDLLIAVRIALDVEGCLLFSFFQVSD